MLSCGDAESESERSCSRVARVAGRKRLYALHSKNPLAPIAGAGLRSASIQETYFQRDRRSVRRIAPKRGKRQSVFKTRRLDDYRAE